MSERKVLNKYFPPNFDPSKIQGVSGGGKKSHVVRLMSPFSMRCLTCSEWIPKGKKFNARKERAKNENYLGIQIYRFYIKCPLCSSDITFKTDPKNTDYVAEHGSQRNFEPWKDEIYLNKELESERLKQDELNPMLALENRTMDSKREMEILDALDELRTRNAKNERLDANSALEKLLLQKELDTKETILKQQQEDDAIIQQYFKNADGETIKRVDEFEFKIPKSTKNNSEKRKQDDFSLGIIKKKKSIPTTSDCTNIKNNQLIIKSGNNTEKIQTNSALNLLGDYGDSDNSE